MSKSSHATATVIQGVQQCDPASKVNLYNCFLQQLHEGEFFVYFTFLRSMVGAG
jgi:hypothetical protein